MSEYFVECVNEECGWEGASTNCVTFKNDDSGIIWCPECNDAVEIKE